jgi:hypothetical protein
VHLIVLHRPPDQKFDLPFRQETVNHKIIPEPSMEAVLLAHDGHVLKAGNKAHPAGVFTETFAVISALKNLDHLLGGDDVPFESDLTVTGFDPALPRNGVDQVTPGDDA